MTQLLIVGAIGFGVGFCVCVALADNGYISVDALERFISRSRWRSSKPE